MRNYHALCSDCPKCGKENIAFLAYSHHTKGVVLPMLKRMSRSYCFHEYHQSIQEMVLRPKTQEEIDTAGGEHALAWI
jgi:predicted amidophosphoribosyltransferase